MPNFTEENPIVEFDFNADSDRQREINNHPQAGCGDIAEVNRKIARALIAQYAQQPSRLGWGSAARGGLIRN